MAKRKITLDEAFAVFKEHGLQVEVKGIHEPEEPLVQPEDLFEKDNTPEPDKRIGSRTVRVELFAAHTVGNGGELVIDEKGNKGVKNVGVYTYGPGICYVPAHLAAHLKHQDALARRADERFLDRKLRTYIAVRKADHSGVRNVGVCVSEDAGFDLSSALAGIGDGLLHVISP